MTIYRHPEFVDETVNGTVNGTVGRQNFIVAAMRKNPQITIKQLVEQTGKTRNTVIRDIDFMRGVRIQRIGPDKTGHWEVIE